MALSRFITGRKKEDFLLPRKLNRYLTGKKQLILRLYIAI